MAQALIRVLCPPLKLHEILTLVSNGPFCGSVDGALVLRISGAGPLASPFILKLAARVTERSIISVSLGRIPRLEFATAAPPHSILSDIPSVGTRLSAAASEPLARAAAAADSSPSSVSDDSAASVFIEEHVLDFLITMNHPADADNPIPTTISKLLVHILDSHVDHVQDIVVKQEMDLDDLEHALDEGDRNKKQLLKVQKFQKIHLDMQRLLQNISSGEQVLPRVKDKMASRQLAAPEDLAAMELLVTRLHKLKENVGFLATRITALQAGLDSWQSEQINRRLYILSFLSVVFLPLSIVTGAFGMNVGGVPWVPQTDPKLHSGFLNVMYICIGIVVLLLLCFAAPPLYTYVTEKRQSHTARKRWHHAFKGISSQLEGAHAPGDHSKSQFRSL
eukprot:SM000046S16351  [mRNA]  locus=s46:26695:29111:- [translate_table: standard]